MQTDTACVVAYDMYARGYYIVIHATFCDVPNIRHQISTESWVNFKCRVFQKMCNT